MKATQQLHNLGQSLWLDNITRDLLDSGTLRKYIQELSVTGLTSNPTIFDHAIKNSATYDPAIRAGLRKGSAAEEVFFNLALEDITRAADLFQPIHERTNGTDGWASIEVSPTFAHDTASTIAAAKDLYGRAKRPNVYIKIPGTTEGLPAIEEAIFAGISVNVTLLFSQDVYENVARAYIAGLEEFVKKGGDAGRVASVASFFVSRIDTLVDTMLAERAKNAKTPADQAFALGLQGKVAIANAKLAYQSYKKIFGDARWQALASRGGQTQRVLWASTGTKNPAFSDVLYVEELIGPDTVNTIPPATYDAFRDHGHVRASLEEGVPEARQTMENLARTGISMKEATDRLTGEGVKLFEEAFDKLLAAVEERVKKAS